MNKIDAAAVPKMYRKTALVAAEQFLPEQGMIPAGVISDGNGDPRKDSNYSFVLDTKEGRHHLRHGDYVCTGPAGEKWNVERSIFESTYELATANVADGGDGEPDEEAAFDKAISTPDANGWTDREAYDGAKLGLIKQGWMKRAALSTIKTTAKAARCLYPNCGCTSRATCNLKTERAATQPAGEVRFRPIRRTSDGVLKECPCCCSLDVGGAYHTVHCQECGLTVSDPGPLQEAIDKWNLRPQPTYAAPISEASAARVTSKADAERVAKQCEECGGKFGVHSAWCSVITPSSPEAKSETSELPGLPESKDRGIYDDIEGKVRVKWYDADEMRAYGQLCRDTAPYNGHSGQDVIDMLRRAMGKADMKGEQRAHVVGFFSNEWNSAYAATSVTVSEDAGGLLGLEVFRMAKREVGDPTHHMGEFVRRTDVYALLQARPTTSVARTPATSGSIADDAEFFALMMDFHNAEPPHHFSVRNKIYGYIDTKIKGAAS
jgi:hypothetical protein